VEFEELDVKMEAKIGVVAFINQGTPWITDAARKRQLDSSLYSSKEVALPTSLLRLIASRNMKEISVIFSH
jgi:hypothetical protein